jgi:hypothetical protein
MQNKTNTQNSQTTKTISFTKMRELHLRGIPVPAGYQVI